MVPPGRLELPRPCGQQILSLSRLPIPPQGLETCGTSYNKISARQEKQEQEGEIVSVEELSVIPVQLLLPVRPIVIGVHKHKIFLTH